MTHRSESGGRYPVNVTVFGVVSLLSEIGGQIVQPLMPLFLASLGVGPAFLGRMEALAQGLASLMKLLGGRLAERLGRRKRLVFSGYLLALASRVLLAWATLPIHAVGARLLDRAGKGLRVAPRDALLVDSVGRSTRGRAFGLARALDHTGALIGSLLAFVLVTALTGESGDTPYRTVFLLAAIPGVVALLVILFAVREVPIPAPTETEPTDHAAAALGFRRYLTAAALFALAHGSSAFLFWRAGELGVPVAQVPLLWGTTGLVRTVLSIPGSALSDRIGRRIVLGSAWLWFALVYVGFARADAAWHAWVLFPLFGVFFALGEGTEKAYIADLVPGAVRARYYGIHGLVTGAAAIAASLWTGWLWALAGAGAALLTAACLATISAIVLISVGRSSGSA